MINLILGDSREELKKIKTNSIDTIITDPPYGIDYATYDNSQIFFDLEEEMYRVLKNNSWLIFWWGIKNIPLISKLNKFIYRWQLICLFNSTYSKSLVGHRTYVPIFVFSKGNPKICLRNSDKLLGAELPIICSRIGKGDFKPTFSLTQLLSLFTKENNLVLDLFMGYGSMGVVCKLFNRNYIGIEKDKIRYEIATKLINEGKLSQSIPDMEAEISPKPNSLF